MGKRRSKRSRRKRPARRAFLGRRLPRKVSLIALATVVGAVCLLNLSVAFFGRSYVFPLSPYFLKHKVTALSQYFVHRSACLLQGHPDEVSFAHLHRAGRRHNLPPGLLAAVIEVESKRRSHRISGAGAMGPAQLMPATARSLGVSDPFEPGAAVDASARLLKENLRRFSRIDLAVAAYNAGPAAVQGRVPQNGETEYYVRKVQDEMKRQRRAETPVALR